MDPQTSLAPLSSPHKRCAVADQMTPDEMRGRAEELRESADIAEEARLWEHAANQRAGADALDRQADVSAWIDRTLARPSFADTASPFWDGVVEALRTVRHLLDGRMHADTAREVRDES